MRYKAVIFDLYGTLVENFPSSESNDVLKQMASVLAISPVDFTAQWIADFSERMNGNARGSQDCIKNICRRLGAQPTDKQIEQAAATKWEMTKREVMSCCEGAVETLSYLKANGLKTGLLSNCSMETTIIWPKTQLAPLIDVSVFSCLERMMKPDPRLFRIAMKRLNVHPEECLYVADGMGQELTAASKLGMDALLVSVPHDSYYEHDREEWHGPAISSLKEIINLVK
jgi:putative hydrolase of the HAD superfamily